MIFWNKKRISEALSIKIEHDFSATGISIDSRNVKPGDIFLGIKGDNCDGSLFAEHALEKGAALCFVSNKTLDNSKIITVDDTTQTLVKMAEYVRYNLKPESTVIGITGSVGKTSTKYMMDLILSNFAPTHSSAGNFNNHYGLPISLAGADPNSKYCILEMGMNHSGEIEYLTNIAKPNIAIITNIAPVHLEFFNSIVDIAHAKAEIFSSMQPNDIALINYDDPNSNILFEKANEKQLKILTFGEKKGANYQLLEHNIGSEKTLVKFSAGDKVISYKIDGKFGKYLAINSLAVFGAADVLCLSLEEAANAISKFQFSKGRGKVIRLKNDVILLDDSYNASPTSVKAALNTLGNYKTNNRRTIAILGDMGELGKNEKNMHKDLAIDIEENKIDIVCTVGNLMKFLFKSLPKEKQGLCTINSDKMQQEVQKIIQPKDVVLIKGSFSMKMSKIVEKLASTTAQ